MPYPPLPGAGDVASLLEKRTGGAQPGTQSPSRAAADRRWPDASPQIATGGELQPVPAAAPPAADRKKMAKMYRQQQLERYQAADEFDLRPAGRSARVVFSAEIHEQTFLPGEAPAAAASAPLLTAAGGPAAAGAGAGAGFLGSPAGPAASGGGGVDAAMAEQREIFFGAGRRGDADDYRGVALFGGGGAEPAAGGGGGGGGGALIAARDLRVGMRVAVAGLRQRQDMNGQEGIVWKVRAGGWGAKG